jgi:hypothetical protein
MEPEEEAARDAADLEEAHARVAGQVLAQQGLAERAGRSMSIGRWATCCQCPLATRRPPPVPASTAPLAGPATTSLLRPLDPSPLTTTPGGARIDEVATVVEPTRTASRAADPGPEQAGRAGRSRDGGAGATSPYIVGTEAMR